MAEREIKPSQQARINHQKALLDLIRRSHEHHVEAARQAEETENLRLKLFAEEARERGGS